MSNVTEENKVLTAPLPGKIIEIQVAVGDAVEEGDVLLILEALKMENEVVSPVTATIESITVETGATVDFGAPLLTFA
jgi:biotin carboxyl carrier protein